jgi:hypothetical protein
VVVDNNIVVRAGGTIVAFALAGGARRWSADLQVPDQGGEVFAAADGLFYCDAVRESDRTRMLIGATRRGVRWRTALDGLVARNGTVAIGQEILAVATDRHGSSLCRIDAKNGELSRVRLPASGAMILRAGSETIVLSPTANENAPGAYVVADAGGVVRVLRTNDVWYGAAAAGRLLTTGARQRDLYTVDLRDIATGAVQWTDTCFNGTAALDDIDAAYVVRGAISELVLRDAQSGVVRWRVDIGDVEPASIHIAGNLVLVRHMLGAVLVRRDTGRVLGDAFGSASFGVTRAGADAFAICWRGSVLLAELPA